MKDIFIDEGVMDYNKLLSPQLIYLFIRLGLKRSQMILLISSSRR